MRDIAAATQSVTKIASSCATKIACLNGPLVKNDAWVSMFMAVFCLLLYNWMFRLLLPLWFLIHWFSRISKMSVFNCHFCHNLLICGMLTELFLVSFASHNLNVTLLISLSFSILPFLASFLAFAYQILTVADEFFLHVIRLKYAATFIYCCLVSFWSKIQTSLFLRRY